MSSTESALIFGASSDIGAAISRELLKTHAVCGTYFCNPDNVPEQVNRRRCDVAELSSIDAVFSSLENEPNPVVVSAFPFDEDEDYFGILKGWMRITEKAASQHNNPRLIYLLGVSSKVGFPEAPLYGGSQAFLRNYSHSMNAVLGRRDSMSIHRILLGPVDTKIWAPHQHLRESYEQRVECFVTPRDVADTVRLLTDTTVAPSEIVLDGFSSLPQHPYGQSSIHQDGRYSAT